MTFVNRKSLIILLVLFCTACQKKEEKVEMMLHARSATLTHDRLVLKDCDPLVSLFSVPPGRRMHIARLASVIARWPTPSPNVVLASFASDGKYVEHHLVLETAKMKGKDSVEFQIKGGPEKTVELDAVALFVDSFENSGPSTQRGGTMNSPRGHTQ